MLSTRQTYGQYILARSVSSTDGDKPLTVLILAGMENRFPLISIHDDVIKWKHFPRNWPFVRGIHRSPVNSPHKGQWRGALMFSLMSVWINGWVNTREAGDLRCYRGHYDVIIMIILAKWVAWYSLKHRDLSVCGTVTMHRNVSARIAARQMHTL